MELFNECLKLRSPRILEHLSDQFRKDYYENLETIRTRIATLIDSGASIEYTCEWGQTTLGMAKNDEVVFKMLLSVKNS